jgi:hypothetical protein
MTNTVEININLSAIGWEDRFPGAKVYIGDQLIFDKIISNLEQKEERWFELSMKLEG